MGCWSRNKPSTLSRTCYSWRSFNIYFLHFYFFCCSLRWAKSESETRLINLTVFCFLVHTLDYTTNQYIYVNVSPYVYNIMVSFCSFVSACPHSSASSCSAVLLDEEVFILLQFHLPGTGYRLQVDHLLGVVFIVLLALRPGLK